YLNDNGRKGILTGVTNGGHECEIQFYLEDGINVEEDPVWNETKEVKLILRPLSDMTEEEAKELFIAKDKHVKIQFEWTSIILTKNPSTKFEKAMKFEPGWRIQAKYRYPNDPNGKEHSMIGELSLGIFSPLQ